MGSKTPETDPSSKSPTHLADVYSAPAAQRRVGTVADIVRRRLSSAVRRAGRALRRFLSLTRSILVVVLATASLGATWNAAYEFLFRQDLWRAGPPVTRWLGTAALTSPAIVVALVTIGLPVTKLLASRGAEGPIQYAIGGGLGGLAFWPLVIMLVASSGDNLGLGLPAIGIAPAALVGETSGYGVVCAVLWWWFVRRNGRAAGLS